MNNKIEIVLIPYVHSARLKKFYKTYKQGFKISEKDKAWAMKENGEIIAALKLEALPDDILLLRSVFVAPKHRKKGLAKKLVSAATEAYRTYEVHCFPFLHLQQLYENCGFTLQPPDNLPQVARDKFTRYKNNGLNIITMKLTDY